MSLPDGTRVTMTYRLTLADGTPVDSSDDEAEIFVIGEGELSAGLESRIADVTPGTSAVFHLQPGEAYEEPDPGNVTSMALADFPDELAIEPGNVVAFAMPSGDEVPGTIMEISDDIVVVDFNHPLAGRELIFEVAVLELKLPGGSYQ